MEVELESITIFARNGKSLKNSSDGTGLPITRIETISEGFVDESKLGYGGVTDLESIGDYLLEDGDILMSHINSPKHLGKSALYKKGDIDIIHGMNLLCIRPDIFSVLPEYLNYFFNSISFRSFVFSISNQSVNQASFATTKLRKAKIPLPTLEEQKTIVAKLDRAQRLIDIDKEMLAKYDQLIQSIFLDMFGDPVTNPKGWEKRAMGDLMTIVRGGSPRPIKEFLGGSYPWIKIGDATKGDDIYLHTTKEKIIEAGLGKTRLLPEGSLIFANCGVSLGFARIIKFQGCIHDGWLAFSEFDENKIDKIFLLKSLNSVTEYFRNSAPDGTQPNLNISIMKKYEIIIPPINLQRKYVETIESIYKEKHLAQISLAKSEELFSSLVQEVFG